MEEKKKRLSRITGLGVKTSSMDFCLFCFLVLFLICCVLNKSLCFWILVYFLPSCVFKIENLRVVCFCCLCFYTYHSTVLVSIWMVRMNANNKYIFKFSKAFRCIVGFVLEWGGGWTFYYKLFKGCWLPN